MSTSIANRNARQAVVDAALWSSTDECILWPFNPNRDYGSHAGAPAHRLVCIAAHGPPSDPRLQAAHLCGVCKCVNPRHLRWATPYVNNVLDRKAHGTFPEAGDDHHRRKITDAQIVELLELYATGVRQVALGLRFGLSQGHVSRLILADRRRGL